MDETIQGVIRGSASGNTHDAVVVLAHFEAGVRKRLCSATLVAPHLLLTARHCVSDTDASVGCNQDGTPVTGSMIKSDRDPQALAVFVGENGAQPDSTSLANAKARGRAIVVDNDKTLCNRDIAFVVLDRAPDAPTLPIRLSPPQANELVTVVGWGIDETGRLPTSREERANVPVVGLGPAMYPDNPTYGYGSREFMLGESVCAGDSGGPALSASGAIVGVAARAGNGKPRDPNNMASTCMGETAHAVFTQLSAVRPLVERAFHEAGEPMQLDGTFDPSSANDSTPDDSATVASNEPPTSPAATALGAPATEIANPTNESSSAGCHLGPSSGGASRSPLLLAPLAAGLLLRRRSRRTRTN